MLVVTVAYIILGISASSASALAVQYTYKTYILINMHDIYLILTKILFKKNALSLYLTLVNDLQFLITSGKKFHNNGEV